MIRKQDMPDCPIALTLQVIGNKWKIYIIQKLEERPYRFNELYKQLDGISRRVLSENLRRMKMDGILERKESAVPPYYVEYQLNDLGRSLIPVLREMARWGDYYKDKIMLV